MDLQGGSFLPLSPPYAHVCLYSRAVRSVLREWFVVQYLFNFCTKLPSIGNTLFFPDSGRNNKMKTERKTQLWRHKMRLFEQTNSVTSKAVHKIFGNDKFRQCFWK